MQPFFTTLKLISRPYSSKMQDLLLPFGLTEVQWGLIRILYEEGPSTFTDIATYWRVEKPSVTPIAQKLIEQELIYIGIGHDKRQKVMHLTNNGVEKYKETKQIVDTLQKNLLIGITEQERQITEQVLEKLLVNLKGR
ncbi:MarR family transcriptional regulator [Psychrobacillus sp. FSL K6-2684]|uniref:MarR family transcriptional regulator n=1 Tax=Psychrobacillus faecigallinarum TaxID=2762235 RepID=A0ABR8R857_9BACI|nr:MULTISPECIES: MarR family transcriptional regulator [Psychrobacillus]MBD7943980.1 MarR family transcriptional regulator [Psychrobacillus faecigallinarum]QEY19474.1 MarR family transcriptional regulator [Psychrobacillus sp. AK 1817]